jgi:hypothetical protein
MILRIMEPRSSIRPAKLTRSPLAFRLIAFFDFAAADASVAVTDEDRCARAALRSRCHGTEAAPELAVGAIQRDASGLPNWTCAFRYASSSPEEMAKFGVFIQARRYRPVGVQESKGCSVDLATNTVETPAMAASRYQC